MYIYACVCIYIYISLSQATVFSVFLVVISLFLIGGELLYNIVLVSAILIVLLTFCLDKLKASPTIIAEL